MVLRRVAEDRTLVDVATRELREMILSGELQPGVQLVLTELAQRLSMSVMPVREAIGRLQAEGLVDQIPHRGARVSLVSAADLEDLYAVRIALETLATREAAVSFNRGGLQTTLGRAREVCEGLRGRRCRSGTRDAFAVSSRNLRAFGLSMAYAHHPFTVGRGRSVPAALHNSEGHSQRAAQGTPVHLGLLPEAGSGRRERRAGGTPPQDHDGSESRDWESGGG